MATNDPVRDYLEERGCGDHVVKRGLEGLVENWESVVRSVEDGYSLGLDDYLNDLDARQLIEEALIVASTVQLNEFRARIEQTDKVFKSLTEPIEYSLWGNEVAEEEGWTPENNWWYYARPIDADPELLNEIDTLIDN